MSTVLFKYVAGDSKKTDHLLALDGAKERLNLFKADLLEEGSFDSAIDGCEGVFHAASPVLYSVTDPQVSFSFSYLLIMLKIWRYYLVFPLFISSLFTKYFHFVLLFSGRTS